MGQLKVVPVWQVETKEGIPTYAFFGDKTQAEEYCEQQNLVHRLDLLVVANSIIVDEDLLKGGIK